MHKIGTVVDTTFQNLDLLVNGDVRRGTTPDDHMEFTVLFMARATCLTELGLHDEYRLKGAFRSLIALLQLQTRAVKRAKKPTNLQILSIIESLIMITHLLLTTPGIREPFSVSGWLAQILEDGRYVSSVMQLLPILEKAQDVRISPETINLHLMVGQVFECCREAIACGSYDVLRQLERTIKRLETMGVEFRTPPKGMEELTSWKAWLFLVDVGLDTRNLRQFYLAKKLKLCQGPFVSMVTISLFSSSLFNLVVCIG